MPKQAAKAHATKERIVLESARLFWEQGYQATSISEILSAAGVKSGSLYYFFRTKQALLVAVLEAYLQSTLPILSDRSWIGRTDPVDRMTSILTLHRAQLAGTVASLGYPVGALSLGLRDAEPAARELIAMIFNARMESLEVCISAIAPELNSEKCRQIARFALATIDGATVQARVFEDISVFDQSVDQLLTFVLHSRVTIPAENDGANDMTGIFPASAAGTLSDRSDCSPQRNKEEHRYLREQKFR